MILSKVSKLLVLSSLLSTAALCSPVAFAQGVSANQNRVNENLANINRNQAAVNANQAEINRNQEDVNQGREDGTKLNGEQHRSAVATFVQSLLNVANREKGGIGDQVKKIANEQNDSKDSVAKAIDEIQNRSGLKTLFIGTDYKNLGQLRSEMVKTENQINQMTRLLANTTSTETRATLELQIKSLTQEQNKINDFVTTNDSKFSLFGWFVKLFY